MEPTQDKLLASAAQLFADHGYAGVSMRHIARSTGITQAAIYHHFSNKQDLYLASVDYLYGEKLRELVTNLGDKATPEAQLELVVYRLMSLLDEQPALHSIYFRELLDGDNERLNQLSQRVFPEIDAAMDKLMESLAPEMDTHLLVLSLIGLVFHHLQTRKLAPHLPRATPANQDVKVLADHVTTLFLNGVRQQ